MAAFEIPASALLADWQVPVIFGAISTIGILDEPTSEVANGMIITTDYKLTYETATMPLLSEGVAIKVDGQNYSVRTVQKKADGVFSEAVMTKLATAT